MLIFSFLDHSQPKGVKEGEILTEEGQASFSGNSTLEGPWYAVDGFAYDLMSKAMWGSVYLPLLEKTDSVEYWVAGVSPVPSNAAVRVHMGSGLLEHQRLAVGG